MVGVYFSSCFQYVLTPEVVAGQIIEPLGLQSRLIKMQDQRGDREGGMEG